MQICDDNDSLKAVLDPLRAARQRIAFVPTMGNLHSGHLHLMDQARLLADCVVASIYVNPTQFGPNEDFDSYPRTLEEDAQKLKGQGVDVLYTPSQTDIYPQGLDSIQAVELGVIASRLCGASRPGHFAGVATVVLRLFDLVRPDVALFGRKDFQQLRVIEQATESAGLDIEIIGVETVREKDGLAMSSRNQYLTELERARAPALYAVLKQAGDEWHRGAAIGELQSRARGQLQKAGLEPDYFDVYRLVDLAEADSDDEEVIILAAVQLGRARLIDNLVLRQPSTVVDVFGKPPSQTRI